MFKNSPNTIHNTIQLPVIATSNIAPNNTAHADFCCHGSSYGRVGETKRHSVINSLKKWKEKKRKNLNVNNNFIIYTLVYHLSYQQINM